MLHGFEGETSTGGEGPPPRTVLQRLGFLLGGLVVGVVAGFTAAWLHYRPLLDDKEAAVRALEDLGRQHNAVITEQQRKVSALSKLLRAQGGSPDSVDATIAKLKSDLKTAEDDATAAPRDPNALYQAGHIVGIVRGANPDPPNKTVSFSAITAPNEIALPGNFEFMQWRLSCADSGLRATTTLGQRRELNYYRVECRMR